MNREGYNAILDIVEEQSAQGWRLPLSTGMLKSKTPMSVESNGQRIASNDLRIAGHLLLPNAAPLQVGDTLLLATVDYQKYIILCKVVGV